MTATQMTLQDYRAAHEAAGRHRRGQAVVGFRTVVADLFGEDPLPRTEPMTRRAHSA